MSSSLKETRSEATARVTRAVAVWYWSRGCRLVVPEVGLRQRLMRPWGSPWRVDLVAAFKRQTHVIEVKGTRADLVREDLTAGKWTAPHPGLCLWLALSHEIRLHQNLSGDWGIIRVRNQRVTVERQPAFLGEDSDYARSLEIVGSCLCMQGLPTLMGLSRAGQMAALETDGFDRPWRQWTPSPSSVVCEEFGNIL